MARLTANELREIATRMDALNDFDAGETGVVAMTVSDTTHAVGTIVYDEDSERFLWEQFAE